MDSEKIKELAEQYADKECAMSFHKGRKLLQLHDDKIIEFYDVLGFLSETHCIVEKSKVLEEYNYYKNSWNETELTETIIESLEDIFGSELFNDKEK